MFSIIILTLGAADLKDISKTNSNPKKQQPLRN